MRLKRDPSWRVRSELVYSCVQPRGRDRSFRAVIPFPTGRVAFYVFPRQSIARLPSSSPFGTKAPLVRPYAKRHYITNHIRGRGRRRVRGRLLFAPPTSHPFDAPNACLFRACREAQGRRLTPGGLTEGLPTFGAMVYSGSIRLNRDAVKHSIWLFVRCWSPAL